MGTDDRRHEVAGDTAADTPAGSSAPSVVERGSAIGRYIVVSRLGAGAMGEVYSAYDPDLDRKVALKLLRPDVHGSLGGSQGRTRILREAQALARLSHPNVVAVYDVGALGERVFVAMELIEGETLSAWLRRKPRSHRQILDVFAQAGRGLAAAHEKGIVHRDFKPDNVLIGADGRVRVLDFGLARGADREKEDPTLPLDETDVASDGGVLDSPLTRTGALLGTPLYMAPEQFLRIATDARTDQFSFCVALYEALYGARPFAARTLKSLAFEVTQGEVQKAPPDRAVPAWIRAILMRGLSRKPNDRFADMGALLAALERDPAAARRRWIYAALAVAVATAGVGGALAARRQHGRICAARDDELADVWDAARKREIADAFRATGKPYAEKAWTSVARAIDGWTTAWLAMRVDACEATRLRGEQSGELLDLRMQCLRTQRQNLKATTDLFAHADAGVLQHAVEAASALPPLDSCADAASLLATLQPPTQTARTHVEALRSRVGQLNAEMMAGVYTEAAIDRARVLVRDAQQSQYPPVAAEALLLLGSLEVRRGLLADSRQALIDAAAVGETSRHDRAVAEALIELVYVVGYCQRRFDEAVEWGRLAGAVADRARVDDRLRSYLHNNLGAVFTAQGKLDQGLEHFRESLRLKRLFYGPDAADVALALNNVGYATWQRDRSPEAMTYNRQALEMLARTVGEQHPWYGTTLSNLGEMQLEKGSPDEALATYQRALGCLEAALAPSHRFVIEALIGVGEAAEQLHDLARANAALERAVTLLAGDAMADRAQRAQAGFALARTLWEGGKERERAHRLAVAARDEYAALGEANVNNHAAVAEWMRSHR